jgi:Tfp pilus assembly protein PilN
VTPAAALSPLFAGETLLLPEADGHYFRYTDDNGSWLVKPESLETAPTFQDALPRNVFEFGDIAALPAEEQAAWIPALVLGAYALSHAAGEDAATMLPVPENLRPHRNQMLKLLAMGLLAYIVLILAIGIGRQFQKRRSYLRQIESEYKTIQARIAELNKLNSKADQDFAATLRQEIQDNRPQGPDFPDVLAELSRLITPPAWISQRLEWNSGLVNLQLVSPTKDLDLAGKLEDSDILGDVREQSSSYSQNQYTTRFTLNARLDTPEEAEALSQRRAAAAAAAAAKQAEKAKSTAEEDDNADNGETEEASAAEDADDNAQDGVAPEPAAQN